MSLRQQRKPPQAPPSAQIPMQHNIQSPETSPDPALRDRNRTIKPPTMPPVMMFANSASQQPQTQSQNSPGLPGVRRSPPPGQASRLLPSPPHPTPPNAQDGSADIRVSPSPTNVNTAYPRPVRGPPAQLLSQFQAMSDNWDMPDEIMAEIERAELQKNQAQSAPQNITQSSHSYSLVDTGTPPKDPPVMDRTRPNERTSPKELENAQRRQREQQQARESPKNRDRQQNSPSAPALRNSPEQRISPSYHGEPAPAYAQYTRDSPQVTRRQTLPDNRAVHTIASQSPPTQSINRTPDRSLPVQEEAEDEPATVSRNRDYHPHTPEQQRHPGSPTPSSDLNPDGSGQRYDGGSHSGIDTRPGQRNDNDPLIHLGEVDQHRSPDEDDSYTPRSPTAGLPDDPRDKYYTQSSLNGGNMRTVRARGRNSASDSMGLRALEQAFDPAGSMPPTQDHRTNQTSPQYDQRRPAQPKPSAPISNLAAQVAQAQPQSPPAPTNQPAQGPFAPIQPHVQPPTPGLPPHIQPKPQRVQELRGSAHLGYYDLQHFLEDPASAYIHAYLSSPRPDAPIPPTPLSQTAAPSPSPLLSGMFDNRDMPPFSPIAPVGSPYPYPFTHVRRPPAYSSSNRSHMSSLSNSGLDPNVIQEQMVRQWQIYAQNNNGHMTDSTFSPSTTPFQNAYNPWAFLHTNRTLGGGGRLHPDAMSMQSSPSHEPVPLPAAPRVVNRNRERERDTLSVPQVHRERDHSNLRNQVLRKPPPRVESTQPRDTSPEPESSEGEETAGEETYSVGGDEIDQESENGHLAHHHHHHHPSRWMNGSSGSGGSGSTMTEHGLGVNNGVGDGHHIYGHAHSHSNSNSVTTVVADLEDNEEDWVDEADDDDDDLLELEYHPSYVGKEDKRRRKWEVGWEALSQAFAQLDRQTDATMILLAAPSHTSKLYSLRSRFIRRNTGSPLATHTSEIRSAFRKVATHRRSSRTQRASMRDRILTSSLGSNSETGTAISENEVELRRALDTAWASMDALRSIYDQREARWTEEMRRLAGDRERVELLLKQVVGSNSGFGLATPMTPGLGLGLSGMGMGMGFVPPVTVMPPPPS